MHRHFVRVTTSVALVTLLTSGSLSWSAASGASASAFCKTAESLTSVPSPTLPADDTLGDLSRVITQVAADVRRLKKDRSDLTAASQQAPDASLGSIYRAAASAAAAEDASLAQTEKAEATVLAHLHDTTAIVSLVDDVLNAVKDAATANTYLAVERTSVHAACR